MEFSFSVFILNLELSVEETNIGSPKVKPKKIKSENYEN